MSIVLSKLTGDTEIEYPLPDRVASIVPDLELSVPSQEDDSTNGGRTVAAIARTITIDKQL